VQQALESTGSDAERMALALELRGRVWVAMQCPHANHVLQKCITSMPPQCSQFILDELLSKGVVHAAQHKYGCRVIQRLLEHLAPVQVEELRESLLVNAHRMSRHQYGNYVMQHLIEHGSPEHQQRLVQELCEDVAGLGSNLYGAAVVAVALGRASPEDQLALARAIAKAPGLIERMSSTRHGHLVVKRTIVALEGTELEAEVGARVTANVKAMAAGRYGRVLAVSVGLLPTAIHGGSDEPVDEA
jgi:pumilio RNA-binding family